MHIRLGAKKNCSKHVSAQIVEAGYTHVYTADSGFVRENQDHISRVCIEKNQPLNNIKRWIEGGYDAFLFFAGKYI